MNRIHDLFLSRAFLRGMVFISAILLIQFASLSCEKEENYSKYDAPADHTVSQEGAMHKSGLDQPLDNCIGCHGDDLKGGSVGVSCYECHDKEW